MNRDTARLLSALPKSTRQKIASAAIQAVKQSKQAADATLRNKIAHAMLERKLGKK